MLQHSHEAWEASQKRERCPVDFTDHLVSGTANLRGAAVPTAVRTVDPETPAPKCAHLLS